MSSQALAAEYGHSQIEPLHILIALMQQHEGVVPQVVNKIGGRPGALLAELEQILTDRPRVSGSNAQVGLSRDAQNVLTRAEREASKMKDEYVSTEHILLALTEEKSVNNVLERHGVNHNAILQALAAIRGGQRVTSQDPEGT